MIFQLHSLSETLNLGRALGRLIPQSFITCIALDGPLGAGKTHLTRGIAEGAAVTDPSLVSSPTYVLLNIYPGPKPIYHIDAYRMHGTADLAALGLDEIFSPADAGKIVVIEWANRLADALPADHLTIAIEHEGTDPDTRSLEISATGPQSQALLDSLQNANTNT